LNLTRTLIPLLTDSTFNVFESKRQSLTDNTHWQGMRLPAESWAIDWILPVQDQLESLKIATSYAVTNIFPHQIPQLWLDHLSLFILK
jgi:hypothetical protein